MDRVISTVAFQSEVYIFTKQGGVYKMYKDNITGQIQFQRIAKLELR